MIFLRADVNDSDTDTVYTVDNREMRVRHLEDLIDTYDRNKNCDNFEKVLEAIDDFLDIFGDDDPMDDVDFSQIGLDEIAGSVLIICDLKQRFFRFPLFQPFANGNDAINRWHDVLLSSAVMPYPDTDSTINDQKRFVTWLLDDCHHPVDVVNDRDMTPLHHVFEIIFTPNRDPILIANRQRYRTWLADKLASRMSVHFLNQKNYYGDTALMMATKMGYDYDTNTGYVDAVVALLQHGADPLIEDWRGMTVRDHANLLVKKWESPKWKSQHDEAKRLQQLFGYVPR